MGVDKIKKLLHREHNYLKTKQKNTQKVTYWMGGNIWTQHTWYSQYTKNSYNSSSKKKKWAENVNIYLSKIDIRMANRQKRCLTLLIIRELKPQWDATSYLSEWLSSKRQVTGVCEDVEKREPLCTVGL